MVAPARRKTDRTTWLSLQVRQAIRDELAKGPVNASWVKKKLVHDWLMTDQGIAYHGKCIGVVMEGNSNLTRTWSLPSDQEAKASSDDSLPCDLHS